MHRLNLTPVLLGLSLLGSAACAEPQGMALAQALAQARAVSGSVRSAALDAEARSLQAQALANLGGPSLSLGVFAGRVSTSLNLDTSQLAQALDPVIGGIDASLPGANLPLIPNTLSTSRVFSLASVGLTSVWPVYSGGRVTALQGLATGRAHEAEAEHEEAEDKLGTLLAQRYFSVQLARQAAQLRQAAVQGIAEHQRAALLLEQGGLIARSERLRADVALDNARRDETRARSDLAIAELALQRLLAAEAPVRTLTPLFVHSQGAGPLQSFVDAGLAHHPAWAKLASKREQAQASLDLQGSELAPNVVALAHYNLNRSRDQTLQPNWQLGLQLSLPLVSRIDHARLRDAARLQQQQVQVNAEQAQRDIPTLIESQWRAMENARAQVLGSGSAIALADEQLKLARVAFQQAQGTSVDVTDAQLNLAKLQIERLQAAHDYVMALARLLEACGQPQRLPELAASADVRLEPPLSE
jgi:outer membrane protein TolC